nr:DDB1- and CUL4-associated factor 8 isoform X2 [Bactrocera oleae]
MDNIELTSCDKRLSNNKQISAESCSNDDEGKEIAMETVEELLESVITELADDNYIESDSRSTPTKTDKSSSDSGVCVNMEEQSTTNNMDINPDIDMNSTDVNSADNLYTSPNYSGNNLVLCSTFNEESATQVHDDQKSKTSLKCNVEKETEELIVSKTIEVKQLCSSDDIIELPAWPRHTRRGARNYRQSTHDEEEEAEGEGVTVNATEEEQMSPAISDSVNRMPYISSSPIFSDDDDDIDEDDDDDNDDYNDDDDDEDDEDDTDDDDDDDDEANSTEHASNLAEIMNKPKPTYTWCLTYELMRREHGLSGDGRRSLSGGLSPGFNARFYAARHVIERMKISHCLTKHSGCVNCLNFNINGDLLCSGSDDTRIIVWNWAQKKPKCVFKSGHTENIFQTKFINSAGVLDIVSAGRDGQVRRSILPSSGGKPQTSLLYRHNDSVHKLVMSPNNPYEIISAGEDAHIRLKDLRSDESSTILCKVQSSRKKRKIRLFSIAHHPYAPEVCVCGCDNFVRVFDKRNMTKPVHQMCPEHLVKNALPQVTCAVYNNTGSEVLASYSDDFIYLFNNNKYKTGEYLHRYRGHSNHKTIKGVNFFGPNSEYVISGSDCGNIFFWDKNTEAILNFMPGDTMGVVNCLEPHPSIPVLATSGLDSSIKIWTPSSDVYPPDLSKLETCVKRNLRHSVLGDANRLNDGEFHNFIHQFLSHPPRRGTYPSVEDEQNSSSSSEGDSDGFDCPQMEGIQCQTQ